LESGKNNYIPKNKAATHMTSASGGYQASNFGTI
jgi:hypothetical protein